MRVQYASGRQQLPFSLADIAVSSGGNLAANYSLYFTIQGENVAGLNLLSSIVGPIAAGPGQQITLTLNPAVHQEGEYWRNYIISASATPTATDFVQLAAVPADRASLPLTVTFSEDAHLQLSGIVTDEASLPTGANLINGMLRGLGLYVFEYDAVSALSVVAGEILIASPGGRWLRKSATFSTYIEDTTDVGGCDISLQQLNPELVHTPRYAATGSNSEAQYFWLRPSVGGELEAGDRIGMTVYLQNTPRSALFEGHLRLTFRGYADTVTGQLRTADGAGTPFFGLNIEQLYENKRQDLFLPDVVGSDEAYTLSVAANFRPEYFNFPIANYSILSVEPFLYNQAGARVELGWALGDWIYPVEGECGRLCFPWENNSLIVEKGSGLVARRSFLGVGPSLVEGLPDNTSNVEIRLNGDGAVYAGVGAQLSTEVLRCTVSLEAGLSQPSAWSADIPLSGADGLDITVTYPSDGDRATIRNDYPDFAIAGKHKGKLNPPMVTLFVEIGGEIRQFSGFALVDGPNQTFSLTNWSIGAVIGALPTPSSAYFSPYEAVAASGVAAGSGNFPAGTARVAFAYEYDGFVVSGLNHTSPPAIFMASMTFAQMQQAIGPWSIGGFSAAALAAVPETDVLPYQSRRLNTGQIFYWDPLSTFEPDGANVILPDWSNTALPGRWLTNHQSPDVLHVQVFS
ncbi:MAG: hypothetical protein QNJ46_15465 [Leptolyngbyaceae cyanobacterium MO_188.B28]|nr:hypothetical protein [Leptolyngbyaceae cyanobacterium MO_188.B28]